MSEYEPGCIHHHSQHYCLNESTHKTDKDGSKTCRMCAEVLTMGVCPMKERIRQKCINAIEALPQEG